MAKNRKRRPTVTKAPMGRNLSGAVVTGAEASAAGTGIAIATTSAATPLPRDTFPYAFGPGIALLPAPLDPVRQDSGRAEPRISEYDVSWNLPDAGNRHRLVPWKTLRDAADHIPLFRRCIEIRKNETVSIGWDITVSKRAVQTARRADPEKAAADVESDLRKRLDPEIDRCEQFWQMPDKGNGYTFSEWLGQFLEEHYVLDALAIYPRYTFGGDLFSLEILDGSTIKPLLDNRGGRPAPPYPAYQQIVHGFPRGEFTADTVIDPDSGSTALHGGYQSDQLIYIRRAVRTWTPYGYSAVEQALNDGDLYMRRYQWLKSEYTDGVMPAGWLRYTGSDGWSPTQLLEYERDFNDFYSGNTANRKRFRILPPGVEPAESQDVAERYKPEYDLHLIKLLCGHFDTGIAELGFTEAKGLGSAGYHEGQADVQERTATLPMLRWLSSLLTDISRQHLGMPQELEFRFLGLEQEDEAAADAVADARVASGRMTYNEDRDRQGLPRYTFPEADMPIVKTGRGVIFLEGASELAPPGEMVTPLSAPDRTDADGNGIADSDQEPPPGEAPAPPGQDEESQPPEPAAPGAAKAELGAFQRWASKRSPQSAGRRPFMCKVLTKDDAPDLADDPRIVFAPASGADPKAGAPGPSTWTGWGPDLEAVAYWAPRLQSAMKHSVDADQLAERWLSARITTKAATDQVQQVTADTGSTEQYQGDQDALAWLEAAGISVTAALALVSGIHAAGYLIGERSATAALLGSSADWTGFRPGQAVRSMSVQALGGLRDLTDSMSATLHKMAAGRLRKIAKVLALALRKGSDTKTLARDLAAVLDDEAWARAVATTEVTRASSSGALDAYRAQGVTHLKWLTEQDRLVCITCQDNEDAGPVAIGTPFPSGDLMPPAHPSCRCAPLPA